MRRSCSRDVRTNNCMEKRKVSSLTPYYKKDDTYYFFLQMRDSTATNNPNRLGLFGGGLEGEESPEEAIIREIKEELNFDLKNPVFFCHFEFMNMVQDAYTLEVEEDFKNKVTVLE